MAGEPALSYGDSGEWVTYLQQLLASAGAWQGATDGEFNDDLNTAVVEFQSNWQLDESDGVVGPDTWTTLRAPAMDWSQFPEMAELVRYGDNPQAYLALLGVDESVLAGDEPEFGAERPDATT